MCRDEQSAFRVPKVSLPSLLYCVLALDKYLDTEINLYSVKPQLIPDKA